MNVEKMTEYVQPAMSSDVTVIIPTMCDAPRADYLYRAIESVASEDRVSVAIIVVVNGTRVDPALLDRLLANPRIHVARLEAASLPAALRHGRSLVRSTYFAFLDDDDEYLPGALAIRVEAISKKSDADVIVTNGYDCVKGEDSVRVHYPHLVKRDPAHALLRENWLASAAGLYRTRSVDLEYFDGTTKYLEWTLLAFRLCLTRRVDFVDTPTYRIYDSPGSLSKLGAYREAEVGVIRQILALQMPALLRYQLLCKLGRALHGLSQYSASRGDARLAWKHHLRSLLTPHGLGYLPYTRHLLHPMRAAADTAKDAGQDD